jgi:hypothetical protein
VRTTPPGFARVPTGTLVATELSPLPPEDDLDFRGLLLAAPEEVTFTPGGYDVLSGEFTRVPVCGTYQLAYGELDLDGRFVFEVLIVAVDAETQEVFSGRMDPGSAARPQPTLKELGLTREAMREVVVTGHFNPNLVSILDLPQRPATYLVHAALGPYTSRVVRIRVRHEEARRKAVEATRPR